MRASSRVVSLSITACQVAHLALALSACLSRPHVSWAHVSMMIGLECKEATLEGFRATYRSQVPLSLTRRRLLARGPPRRLFLLCKLVLHYIPLLASLHTFRVAPSTPAPNATPPSFPHKPMEPSRCLRKRQINKKQI